MEFERINYRQGWQRLFYVSEIDDVNLSVSVHSYTPEGHRKDYEHIPNDPEKDKTLKLLESGVYTFDFYFRKMGKCVFIVFEFESEEWVKKLIIIVTVNNG